MMMPTTYSSVIVCLLEPIARVRVRDGNDKEENRRDNEDHVRHGLSSERHSVEIEADLGQEEMVSLRGAPIADRVAGVDRYVGTLKFVCCARAKVAPKSAIASR